MYEKVVYTGPLDVVLALDHEFERGVPVPVAPSIARKLYRNKEFKPYTEEAAPPAEEPVVTEAETTEPESPEPESPEPVTNKEE